MQQTLTDGKPIIIEGLHLDPALFIPEFARAGVIMLPARAHAVPKGGSPTGTGGAAGQHAGGGGGAGGDGERRAVRCVFCGKAWWGGVSVSVLV
jgi:hypothetical protein